MGYHGKVMRVFYFEKVCRWTELREGFISHPIPPVKNRPICLYYEKMQNWNGVKFTREKKLGNSRLSKWKFQMKVLMYTWNILNFPFHLGKYKSGIWNSIFKDLCWISKSISYQIIRNQDLSQFTLFPPCIIKYIWFFQYQTFIKSRIFL